MAIENRRIKGLVKTTTQIQSDQFEGRHGWSTTLARFIYFFGASSFGIQARTDVLETFAAGIKDSTLTAGLPLISSTGGRLASEAIASFCSRIGIKSGIAATISTDAQVRDVRSFGAVVGSDSTAAFVSAQSLGASIRCTGGPFLVTGLTISVPIEDTVNQIFATGSTVTISNGLPVRPEWFGSPSTQGAIKLAVESLPSTGGEIALRHIRYAWSGYGAVRTADPYVPAPNQVLSKAGVTIRGEKRPRIISNAETSAMTEGTIIDGPFNVYADNFSISNLGVDSGPAVCAANYAGVSQDGFAATFTTASTPSSVEKTALSIDNVICLCKASVEPVHACLIEKFNGVTGGFIETFWGGHGLAIKSKNVTIKKHIGTLHGYDGSIIKSDGAAQGGMASAENVRIHDQHLNSCRPSSLILQSGTLPLVGVKIDRLDVQDTANVSVDSAISFQAEGSTALFDTIRIGELISDKASYAVSQNISNIDIRRLSFGRVQVTNAASAGIQLDLRSSNYPVTVETHEVENVRRPVLLYTNTVLRIQRLIETVGHASETEVVKCNANSFVAIGDYQVAKPLVPAASWTWNQTWFNYGTDFNSGSVDFWDNKVRLKGLVRPGTSTSLLIGTVAREFRPPKQFLFPIISAQGATITTLICTVKPDGTVNLSSLPASTDFVSLDGIEW